MLPHQCQGWGDCCWIVFNICQSSFLNSRDVTKNANNYDGNVQELTSSSKKCAQSDLISHLRSYKSGLEQKKVWRQKNLPINTEYTGCTQRSLWCGQGPVTKETRLSEWLHGQSTEREVQLKFYFYLQYILRVIFILINFK